MEQTQYKYQKMYRVGDALKEFLLFLEETDSSEN